MVFKFPILTLIISIISWNKIWAQNDPILLEYFTQEKTGIGFINTITETEDRNIFTRGMPYLYAGGGVAAGDINNDGLPDIFFVGNEVPSKLFINKGNLKFEDETKSYGIETTAWCTGSLMADVNGDGWLDIFILKAQNNDSATGGNMLYINQGGKKFKEQSAAFSLNTNTRALSASFFDMDNDGDLDLYLARYPDNSSFGNDINFDFNKTYKQGYGTDYLFENIDNKKFKDITNKAGIKPENGFGISVITTDFNKDGFTDIYVGNDFAEHDYLYLNNGNKTFTESVKLKFAHTSFYTMGVDYNDLNNDLLPDLLTLDMNPEELEKYKTDFNEFNYDIYEKAKTNYYNQEIRNTLQIQNKNGNYSDIAQIDKVAFTDWSWSPLLVDFDNDGLKDIFISNGLKKDVMNQDFYLFKLDSILKNLNKGWDTIADTSILKVIPSMKLQNYFFQNTGKNRFANTSKTWTNTGASVSTGAAYADFDNDGDLDLITNEIDTFPIFYKNNAREITENNFIGFQLKNGKTFAYGAKIFLYAGENTLYQELVNARGFMSSSQPVIHFGLNKLNKVDSVVITFQGNTKGTVIYTPEINMYHTVNLSAKNSQKIIPETEKGLEKINFKTIVTPPKTTEGKEDFKFQPLLFQRCSQQIPVMLTADLNGDGFTDIIYGAFAGKPLQILLQNSEGNFIERGIPGFSLSSGYDHSKLHLSDLDNDTNPELIAVTNDFFYSSSDSSSRNFLEVFTIHNLNSGINVVKYQNFPIVKHPISAMAIADANSDGNQEIYLFGATTLEKFPNSFPALIISKKDKIFELDSFIAAAPSQNFSNYIITDAAACDFNSDNLPDIHFSTFYDRPYMLENLSGKFNMPLLSSAKSGLWNKSLSLDINRDGKQDAINLNFGLNTRFNLKSEERITLLTDDFDNNGQPDPVMCIFKNGKNFPIYTYSHFTAYFPYSRKKVYDYQAYSKASMEDIYLLKNANRKSVETLLSRLKLYDGTVVSLPGELQWTTLNDVFIDSLNNRLIFGGNNLNLRPDIGYSDAASLIISSYNLSGNKIEFTNSTVYNFPNIEIKQVESCKTAKGTYILTNTQNGIFLTDILIEK